MHLDFFLSRTIPRWLQSLKKFMTPPPIPGLNKHFTHQQNCKCSHCTVDMGLLINEHNIKRASSASSRDDEVPTSDPPEPLVISPPGSQESKSPIVSHNEVSSSAQDPPELESTRSRSPSPGPGVSEEQEAPLPLLSEYKAPMYSWHHPSLTPVSGPTAPLMSAPGGPMVPLLLPACSYPSLSHSLVYMNPFMPPCQSALAEKKKRNRTFIDPVTEVSEMLLNSNLEVRIDLDQP